MPDILFARPRWNYESYADLYRLIELSGFPLIYFDEIDPQSDNLYILTTINGECQNGWQSPRARIIWWDLEWRIDGDYPHIPGIAETWAADSWYAQHVGARYVPMGSHSGLKLDTPITPDVHYHAAYMGYMVNRRLQIWTELVNRGLRLSPMSAWGEQRHNVLMQSACYVHVHQLHAAPGLPALRLVVAAAYSLPFLTETVQDAGVFMPSRQNP